MVVLEQDVPLIRRPAQQGEITGDVGTASQCVTLGLAQPERVADQQALYATFVADVGDPLAILAPARIRLAHARGRRQVANRAILDGYTEDVPSGRHEHALAGRRELGRG